ncbi:hypothetical protein [Aequorivita sinensis]|uniref:hypothetical protein n=1 Tax=Aequorivita sinensis TaxID=1382458 RepID=UPI0023017485|nr:hypothetical protein [Aequorivita sinensis]
MIDKMESGSDHSRTQEFLEQFWDKRTEIEDARDSSFGRDKSTLSKLLDLFNRKGDENDMEPY